MHSYQFTLKITAIEGSIKPTPELVLISGQLDDEDWDLLMRFNERAIELFHTRFVQSGMQSNLNIKMEPGVLSFCTQLPDRDDLAAFLHRLRPFFLSNEETNFDKICELIKAKLANPSLTSIISDEQAIYHVDRLQNLYTIRLTMQDIATAAIDDFIVNSDEYLKKWLYSSEYHFDNNKRELIESFETIMPLEAQIPVFIQLLGEKIDAISHIASILRVILGLDRDTKIMVRK